MEYKALDDRELNSLLESHITDAESYFDNDLADERKSAYEYYTGEKPSVTQKGRSKYVSQDVFDVVESLNASLLETFSGNKQVVQFSPMNEQDVALSKQATEYTNYVFYHQNDGYGVLSSVIQDGLLGRIGVAKAYWEEDYTLEDYDFNQITLPQLEQLLAQEDVELKEQPDMDEMGMLTGTFTKRIDTSKVRVDALAPEEFIMSATAKSVDEADFVAHRVKRTISDLIKEGYDKTLAKEAYDSATKNEYDEYEQIRFDYTTGDWVETERQEQTTKFWVHECYVEADLDGTGEATLWRIVKAGDVILDKQEVDSKPFFVFSPLANAHSAIGTSLVERLKPIQNAKTTLTRSILDHTVITNNPRMQVVKGTLMNARELMDDRVGGLVNVTRPDGILPLPQSPMNPYAFNVIQMLDEDKEDATGVSRLSQGLNKDAVSKQNSADMMGQMVTLSQQRQKIIARNLSEKFFKPLFIYIYKLVADNESKQKVINVSGEYVDVDPTTWVERKSAYVEFSIGYQEAEKEAQELMAIYQMMSQDQAIQVGFGYDKRFEAYKRILEKKGIKDINAYLTPPQQIKPPSPDPMQKLQVENMQKQMEVQERQTRIAELKAQLEMEESKFKMQLDAEKAKVDSALKADKQELDEDKLNHSKAMDLFEKSIVERKANQGMDEVNASANVSTGGM